VNTLRAVATDLDGTIVHDDTPPSPRTVAALQRVTERGGALVIVTARPPRYVAHLLGALDHHGLVICANGAVVYDLATEQVVRDRSLAPSTAFEIVERLRAEIPGIAFAAETHSGFTREPHFVWGWSDPGSARTAAAEHFVDEPVTKLLVRHPDLMPDEVIAAARRAVGDLAVHHDSGEPGMLELSAPGVSKATALEELTSDLGIAPDEVVAFGDMPNDVPMLTWAGIGVAVANAHADVLAVADAVTASCVDDGVAQWLDTHWL
jgi:Cof subfamily protein (haloacid dehalogenase superfamily)